MALWRLLSLALVAATHALPHNVQTKVTTAPVVPSKDSFYNVPTDLNNVQPGTILKHRLPPAPIAAFREDPVQIEASHQILYRTTDSLGRATATVLTVLVPYNADFSKVLSYQVAEDAACVDCAPSYVFQLHSETGPNDGTSTTQLEVLLIEAALEQGWVVIVPDHEGPTGAFLANRLGGQATLDGIRAALQSGSLTGISKTPTITMWGYSGGSFVTGWAAELQPSYAPELHISGAAVGGTVPNITSIAMTVNNGSYVGLVPSGMLGMASQFPDFAAVIKRNVKPEFSDEIYQVLKQCAGANSAVFGNRDVLGMFEQGFISDPVTVKTLYENSLGHTTPRIPLYWYKSTQDQISVIKDSDDLVAQYCHDGATIEYVRDIWSDHGSLAVLGAFRALGWLKNIMDGTKPAVGCSKSTVLTSLLDLDTVEFLPKFIIDALLDLLGKHVGPLFG